MKQTGTRIGRSSMYATKGFQNAAAKAKKGMARTAAALSAGIALAAGAAQAAWAAESASETAGAWMLQVEEDEARLADNILEYDELFTLVSRFSPSIQDALASYNSSLQMYADAWTDLKLGQYSASGDRRQAGSDDDAETESYYASEEAIYKSAANTYKTMYDNLQKASGTSSLRSSARQLTAAAQALMISYETLRLQRDTLTKQQELYQKAYELAQTKQAAGLGTQADVLEAQSQVESAVSALAKLEEQMDSVYSSLCLSVGREADGSLTIAPMPAADLTRAEGMNLEEDTAKAIGNNTELISKRHESGQSTAARISRNAGVEEGEQKLASSMKTLYGSIQQKKAELEAARTGYERAAGEKQNADVQYAAGLLSLEAYIDAELSYLQETAEYKAADLAFTQAADTYEWAVLGIAQTE